MRLSRIRSPQQDHIRIFGFTIGTCTAARSEYRRQTGDAGGVSSSVATIDVVRSHHGTNKLLRWIVQLIGGLGAAEHAEVARIMPVNRSAERRGHTVHGFIPRGNAVPAVFTDQGLRKARFHWLKHILHSLTGFPKKGASKIVAPFRPESTCYPAPVPLRVASAE